MTSGRLTRWVRAPRAFLGAAVPWRALVLCAATVAAALGFRLHPVAMADAPGQVPAVLADVADCTASADGTARYFVSVRSTTGADITHAVGRLFGTGSENAGQVVNMFNGDLESQADDGSPAGGCVPRPGDGRANDLGSTFVPAVAGTHTWSLQVLAAGSLPAPSIDLSPFVDGSVCPLGDGAGCLISLGTVTMTGVGLPSASGAASPTPTATRTVSPTPTPTATVGVVSSPTWTPSATPSLPPTEQPVPTATTVVRDPIATPVPGEPGPAPTEPGPGTVVVPEAEPEPGEGSELEVGSALDAESEAEAELELEAEPGSGEGPWLEGDPEAGLEPQLEGESDPERCLESVELAD